MPTTGTEAVVRRAGRAGAAAGLAWLTAEVARQGPLMVREQRRLVAQPGPAGRWEWITKLGSGPVLAGMTVAATTMAAARRRSLLRPAGTVLTGMAARAALMHVVSRERPPRERWRVRPDGPSYPSRHVTWCTLGILALLSEVPPAVRPESRVLAAGVVALECYSRLRLGVHWPSDTAAGVLLALTVSSVVPADPRSPAAGDQPRRAQ